MSAQEEWKQRYMSLFEAATTEFRNLTRYSMYDIRREAALERKLEAAQRQLEAERNTALLVLHGMIDGWRDYAGGHYCRTYNPGMTQGLNCAADALEAYIRSIEISKQDVHR